MRPFRIISLIRAAALICGAVLCGHQAVAEAPKRVVSINLCTDQLALHLAAPGQIISVTHMAADPDRSTMVDRVAGLHLNRARAEEIYLLSPDLVLAGQFTAPATISMLRNLGIPVEQFAPANRLADIPANLTRMGRVLGRDGTARDLIARFESDLATLSTAPEQRPRAALTYVNSFTSGDKTLAGDILRAAGFHNVADDLGLNGYGTLSLEDLVLLNPNVIIRGRDYPGAARAEDNLHHPALNALTQSTQAGDLVDRDWICGTPDVLNAVRMMRDLRLSLAADP